MGAKFGALRENPGYSEWKDHGMAAGEEFRVGLRLGEDYRVDTGRNGSGRDDPNGYDPHPAIPFKVAV